MQKIFYKKLMHFKAFYTREIHSVCFRERERFSLYLKIEVHCILPIYVENLNSSDKS